MTAAEKLFRDSEPLAGTFARRFAQTMPPQYRCQEAEIRTAALWGLWQACRSYDPGRRVPFPAYARLMMRRRVLDWLRHEDPTPAAWRRAGYLPAWFSLEAPVSPGDDEDEGRVLRHLDLLPYRPGPPEAPELCAELVELALAGESERDRELVRLVFAEDMRQVDVSRRLGLAQSSVYRRLANLLERCRKRLQAVPDRLPANLRGGCRA